MACPASMQPLAPVYFVLTTTLESSGVSITWTLGLRNAHVSFQN